jgi:5'-deoxynucleotidase YfbR-like HD superfamily hydrolase
MEDNLDFERLRYMRRVARVARVHTHPTIRTQTVGEHTFNVLALIDFVNPEASIDLWRAALWHDAPEGITGDVPSTAKWRFPILEDGLKEAESAVKAQYGMIATLTMEQAKILKFCDLMELAIFAIEEVDHGDITLRPIAVRCIDAIEKRKLVDVTPNAMRLFLIVKTFLEQGPAPRSTFHEW